MLSEKCADNHDCADLKKDGFVCEALVDVSEVRKKGNCIKVNQTP